LEIAKGFSAINHSIAETMTKQKNQTGCQSLFTAHCFWSFIVGFGNPFTIVDQSFLVVLLPQSNIVIENSNCKH
jgi:hypothetical protein